MHDYILSMVNDHIDEKIKNDVTDFIIKTHNRHNVKNTPFPVVNTFIKDAQALIMERTEHEFSTTKISLPVPQHPSLMQRLPSAKLFKRNVPLGRKTFETLVINSFSACMVNNRITYPYPSAGGLYTGQVIIYIRNVQGYQPGAYHYLPVSNQFEKLQSLSSHSVNSALFMQDEKHLVEYDFFIFYGSILNKHLCKYGCRGYRFALLEIGSMYRNLEIETQREGLRSIVWGGFSDEILSVTLGIDPRVVVPVMCQIVGKE